MSKEKLGLTLGKYAPFHKGHQFVIDTALKTVDRLIVMAYEDDCTRIPLRVRANWIKTLYKGYGDRIIVIECYNAPQVCGYTKEIMKIQDDYIAAIVGQYPITHVFSSEKYGEHISANLGAENIVVDPHRKIVPICGTLIRKDAYLQREFVSDVVYKDFITTVAFVGSESTGKTTIANKCAEEFNTVCQPEYGAEYWAEHNVNGVLTPKDLENIAVGHLCEEERQILNANIFLFVDTSPLTTWMFSQYYHGTATQKLTELTDKSDRRYDVMFLCDTDIPFDASNGRRNREVNLIQQRMLIDELVIRKIPYYVLSGNVEERLSKIKSVLKDFDKWKYRL